MRISTLSLVAVVAGCAGQPSAAGEEPAAAPSGSDWKTGSQEVFGPYRREALPDELTIEGEPSR